MARISSIVLEIIVGVALGPRGFGIVDPVYTVCETKRVDNCGGPADLDERLAQAGWSLGEVEVEDHIRCTRYSIYVYYILYTLHKNTYMYM